MKNENKAKDRELRDGLEEMRARCAKSQMPAKRKKRNRNRLKLAILVLAVLAAAYFAEKTMRNDSHSLAGNTPNSTKREYRYPVPPDRTESAGVAAATGQTPDNSPDSAATEASITLNGSAQLGSWHVEIQTEDGKVLGRAEFKVATGR